MDFILDDDDNDLFLENQLMDDILNDIYLFDESLQQMLLDISHNKKEMEYLECGICYDEIEKEKIVYLKKCQHQFCQKCILKILGKKSKKEPCPYCRILFSKDDIIGIRNNKIPIKKCKCGSKTHQKTNHSKCPLNKK